MNQKIILIGLMGAGKSTLGRHLAKKFNYVFIDTDHEIEKHTGATIPWIFDIEGEQGFRKRETETLERLLTDKRPMVLATGGGIVLSQTNRALLINSNTFVVYLNVPLKILVQRVSKSTNRPLLKNGSAHDILLKLHQQRNILYEEVADLIFYVRGNKIPYSVNALHKKIIHSIK